MPQTSNAVQRTIDGWFPQTGDKSELPQDWMCHKLLLAKGWTERNGMFSPPTSSYYGPREDYLLLKYLVEEWDYAYECAPLIEVK